MRSSVLFCLVPVALCAAASPSPANVTISDAATANMACSGGVCAPTAVDAVLNVQDLAAMLASGNATVTTTGAGVQAKDIQVKAKFGWATATTLSLDAFRSIELSAKMAVAGTGGLSLTTNDGGSGGEFACNNNGRLQFGNLSSALTINGTSYTLVSSVASLASAIAGNPSGAFALAKNYDAKKDGTYTSSPIGTVFSGSFNGLGNAISNLSINDPTENAYVGLFAQTATGSTISNIRLVNENVVGGSGSSQSSSTEFIGGLVGYANGGTIAGSLSSGAVTGGEYAVVGGLLGVDVANTTGSASSATVSDVYNGLAGGLAGLAEFNAIVGSNATGSVSGSGAVGGLVGMNYVSLVAHSWATGSVAGVDGFTYVGGLVGMNNSAAVSHSHASGPVICQFSCGGLVGMETFGGGNGPKISESFSTGSVSADVNANACTGGLVGLSTLGSISNSYALGAVTAKQAGGLVCQNVNMDGYHAISNSYSTGMVTGQSGSTGGLLGGDEITSTIKHTYWDMTTSGITDPGQGAGNVANDPGIKGLTDKKLKSGLPNGFDPTIWNEDPNINGGLPYLIKNPPPN